LNFWVAQTNTTSKSVKNWRKKVGIKRGERKMDLLSFGNITLELSGEIKEKRGVLNAPMMM